MKLDINRLVYSKYLLRRAKSLHEEGNELASGMAVLAAHDSVEMLMLAVIDFIGAATKKDRFYFMDFWQIVRDTKGVDPPYKIRMARLNVARNSFKHSGNLPNLREVSDMMANVNAFCEEVTQKFLDRNLEDISLADLIINREARQNVKEAEKAIAADDNEAALLAIGIAFDKLHEEARQRKGSTLIQQSHWDRLDSVHVGERYDRELAAVLNLDKLRKPVQQVIDTINMILLGMEPAKFRRFSEITPIRHYMVSGELYHRWRRPPEKVPREDLDFCYEFVVDFGLRLIASS
jgi:hypothetical protein